MKSNDIIVNNYELRKAKNNPELKMCDICSKCKDKTICDNRKDIRKCTKCNDCKKHSNCDKFYFTKQSKATVIVDYDKKTNKPITKVFTGKSNEDVFKKILNFREYVKVNGLPIGVNKFEKTIHSIGLELENDKLNKGKVCSNTYNTNLATLNRLKDYSFSNTPIEKVTKKQIEDFLEVERIKSNSLIKKDYSMLKRIYEYALDKNFVTINHFARIQRN